MTYLILGMHKSGTTLLTQILHHSGINMVDEQTITQTYDEGYQYERSSTRDLNEALLDAKGVTSLDIAPPRSLQMSESQRQSMQEIITTCQGNYGDNWGFKDPRTCLTYPLWRPELPAHKIIVVYRSVEELWLRYRHNHWLRRPSDPTRAWKVVNRWYEANSRIVDYLRVAEQQFLVLDYQRLMTIDNEMERLEEFAAKPLSDERRTDGSSHAKLTFPPSGTTTTNCAIPKRGLAMPTFDSYAAGTPCWVDIMTPDLEASTAFYGSVFGWDTQDEFDDQGNLIYTQFRQGDQIVAGMGAQPPDMDGMPAIWNSYVAVDDVNATAASVAEAGGTVIMPPMQVMDAGHMAVCADPTGAAFSVWQAGNHIGAQIANEPNTWSWNELVSRDVETAKGFYSKVFGWEYDSMDMGEMGAYNVIKGGENGGLGGLMAMPPNMPDQVPNHWMAYFLVSDINATSDAVKAAGGQMVQEPFEAAGVGHIATAHDPHGGTFSVLQPAATD